MNKRVLQQMATDWVAMAKTDMKSKVLNLLSDTDSTVSELAEELGIDERELRMLLDDNIGSVSLLTFAKLLIGTGNALEIHPIEEMMGAMPPHCERHHMCGEECDSPCNNPANGVDDIVDEEFQTMFGRAPRMARRPAPMHRMNGGEFERRFNRNRMTPPQEREIPVEGGPTQRSPFTNKSTQELIDIIKERLWDSEIDLGASDRMDLIEFLNEKDKKIKEYKRMKELENDPKIKDFKNRLKDTFANNPHLRDWAKNILSGLEG